MKEHPFPPVVRWALFPALAALAGAAGGVIGTLLTEPRRIPEWPVMTASFSFAGAFAFSLSRRAWIAALSAPVLGILLCPAFLAVLTAVHGSGSQAPGQILSQLRREPGALLLIGLLTISHTAGFLLASRLAPSAAAGGAAQLGTAAVGALLVGGVLPTWGALALLSGAAQIVPLRVALALSRRIVTIHTK